MASACRRAALGSACAEDAVLVLRLRWTLRARVDRFGEACVEPAERTEDVEPAADTGAQAAGPVQSLGARDPREYGGTTWNRGDTRRCAMFRHESTLHPD